MSPGFHPLPGRAHLTWDDGAPRSDTFGDVYFSAAGGFAETRHVFLDGIGAPGCFAGRQRFVLGELGFGTGLNFLALWDLWRKSAPPAARLHVVSIEGYPLSAADMAAAHAAFPELAPLAADLRARLPAAVAGFHRLRLEGGRVALTLLHGPAEGMLENLSGRFDAWFLDGFAPSRNPEMWTPAVFRRIARLCKPGARLATFSAAGAVRRGLAEAGFEVEKRPGFGAKRECLSGRFAGPAAPDEAPPWFAAPIPLAPGARVAVVGAGIAGRAAARAMEDEGFAVSLVGGDAAAAAPPRVLVAPRLAGPDDPYGRYMAQAFLMAHDALSLAGGSLHLPGGDADRQLEFARRLGWDDGLARPVTQAMAADLAGVAVTRGGLHFPAAGLADPAVCLPVDGIERAAQAPEDAEAVILAAGAWTGGLAPAAGLPLFANRGQVAFLPPMAASRAPRLPVSFGGHVTPAIEGVGHVLGSSYGRWNLADDPDGWGALRQADQDGMLAGLAQVLPGLADGWRTAPLAGWAGLRATTEDHLPMAGPLPDAEAFRAGYGDDMRHGRRIAGPSAPYLPRMYALTGLGSRGFQTALPAAELLASMLSGAPLPVDRAVAEALHPARFLVRDMRKRN